MWINFDRRSASKIVKKSPYDGDWASLIPAGRLFDALLIADPSSQEVGASNPPAVQTASDAWARALIACSKKCLGASAALSAVHQIFHKRNN